MVRGHVFSPSLSVSSVLHSANYIVCPSLSPMSSIHFIVIQQKSIFFASSSVCFSMKLDANYVAALICFHLAASKAKQRIKDKLLHLHIIVGIYFGCLS
jgi:ABC-type enterochelin transport system permease subunit